ncbi:hypothetical protein [Egicoccus halophilus]|uniref:Uncharacterized protein n=1 Tax=Egicoccus halophilus TaxID=1670830 RepID=A0A8J3EVH6_9ACTN|nr:hypothetical protein [Egicoccus halophilus]GGI09161.1 hypothetical protein GCM10011354_32700 [Egicoccus halophilus]
MPASILLLCLIVDIVASGSLQDPASTVAFAFVAATGLAHAALSSRRPDRTALDGAAVALVAWIAALVVSGWIGRLDLHGTNPAFIVVALSWIGFDVITTLVRDERQNTPFWPLIIAAALVTVEAVASPNAGFTGAAVAATALVSLPLGWRVKRVARREEAADA